MEVGEGTLQYVELGGVVGVFIELDASHVDEQRVETILKTAQNQVELFGPFLYTSGFAPSL